MSYCTASTYWTAPRSANLVLKGYFNSNLGGTLAWMPMQKKKTNI